MFEIQMLIPIADNDGDLFSPEHHFAFEVEAVRLFGGLTHYPSTAIGAWNDNGDLYQDATRVYGFAVAGLEAAAKAVELARFAKNHYRQVAIFVRYLGQVEII